MLQRILKKVSQYDVYVPLAIRRHFFEQWARNAAMPEDLRKMLLDFSSSPSFGSMSAYWQILVKDSINADNAHTHYFLHYLPKHISLFENLFDGYNNLYISLLKPYLERLGYSTEGGVNEDRLNSLIDYDSVKDIKAESILEIGGGNGRDARVFIEKMKPKRYVMVDIPPALYHAQKLAKEFPDVEFQFLLPHELPTEHFDLILAIDCLHEMDRKQVNEYFLKLNGTYFYMKAWEKPHQWFYARGEYPTKGWQELFNRQCVFPKGYFEALYRLR